MVEISKEEILGSKRSLYGYILTYFRLLRLKRTEKKKNLNELGSLGSLYERKILTVGQVCGAIF